MSKRGCRLLIFLYTVNLIVAIVTATLLWVVVDLVKEQNGSIENINNGLSEWEVIDETEEN